VQIFSRNPYKKKSEGEKKKSAVVYNNVSDVNPGLRGF